MRTGSHEYANEADDDNVPKPAQSLGTPVPRQKKINISISCEQVWGSNKKRKTVTTGHHLEELTAKYFSKNFLNLFLRLFTESKEQSYRNCGRYRNNIQTNNYEHIFRSFI